MLILFFGRECPRYQRKSYSRGAKQSACVSAYGGSVLVGTHSSQAVPSWYLSDHSGIPSYRRPRDHDQQPPREGGGREADIFFICDRLLCIYFQRLSPDNDVQYRIGVPRMRPHSPPSEAEGIFPLSHLIQFHLPQICQTKTPHAIGAAD